MNEVASLTIAQVRDGLRAKKFSAVELAAEALRFAEAENPKTNAYLTFSREVAESAARDVDARIARGEDPGLLGGVPVAVKDVLSTKGVRTTCASRLLEKYVPAYDATAVERLKAVGALIVGLFRAGAVHLIPQLELFSIYAVMALVLVFRPQGLFSRAQPRKI